MGTLPDTPEPVADDGANDAEPEKAAEEPPELNLSPKQNKMRTDLEMLFMDDIPGLFGVDDSEELDEDLQEDGQATKVTELIAETNPDEQRQKFDKWLRIGEG